MALLVAKAFTVLIGRTVAVFDLWRLCNALIGAGKSVDLLRLSSERVAGLPQLRSPSCLAGAWKRLPACHSLASAHLSKSNSSFSAKPLPRDHVVRRLLRKALIPLTQRSTLSTIQAARRGRLAIPLCQLAPLRSGISPLTALPGEEITVRTANLLRNASAIHMFGLRFWHGWRAIFEHHRSACGRGYWCHASVNLHASMNELNICPLFIDAPRASTNPPSLRPTSSFVISLISQPLICLRLDRCLLGGTVVA